MTKRCPYLISVNNLARVDCSVSKVDPFKCPKTRGKGQISQKCWQVCRA